MLSYFVSVLTVLTWVVAVKKFNTKMKIKIGPPANQKSTGFASKQKPINANKMPLNQSMPIKQNLRSNTCIITIECIISCLST